MQHHQACTVRDNIVYGRKEEKKTDILAKRILDSLEQNPDDIVLVNTHTGEHVTFRELRDCSIRCALWLKKHGIGKDDVVCISSCHRRYDCVPSLATFYIGAIFNPWDYDLTAANARQFFETIKPKVMFASEASIDMLARVVKEADINCTIVAYGDHSYHPSLREIMEAQTEEEVRNFQYTRIEKPHEQIGMILFSSGTTGKKKGMKIPYDSIASYQWDNLGIKEGMRVLSYSPLSWVTGSNLSPYCIMHRATRIIHHKFDSDETCRVIEEYKVNLMFTSPNCLTRLFKAKDYKRYDLSSLKRITFGGSKVTKSVLDGIREDLPNVMFCNSYGMSELGGIVTVQTRESKMNDSVGYSCPNAMFKVLDPKTKSKLGPHEKGELCFKTKQMTKGYVGSTTEFAQMMDNEGWLHTGDIGYYDENGELYVVGRMKQNIIMHGYHISPSQIEDILIQHPDVLDAAVVPVPHEIDDERPLAFVKKVPGSRVTAEELEELPTAYNEHFRIVGGVVFVDELPMTSSGKKNIGKMKEMAIAHAK